MQRLALALLPLLIGCDQILLTRDTGTSGREDARVGLDTGVVFDAGLGSDAAPNDSGPSDVGGADAGADAGDPDLGPADSGVDAGPCSYATLGPADRDRVILVGHPQAGSGQPPAPFMGSLTLQSDGTIVNNGTRLDIMGRFARAEFVPSGELALVVTEDGFLSSVAVDGAAGLRIVDMVSLPSASYGDLRISDDGTTAWIVGFNSTADGGLSVVHIACDGTLALDMASFLSYRLSSSIAPFSSQDFAVYSGGGVDFFDPMDPNETRLLRRNGAGWTEVAGFNFFTEGVDALRIAVSPDGRTAMIPNGSAFSAEMSTLTILDVDGPGGSMNQADRLTDFDDAREVIFSPDGETALVTQFTSGRVRVLRNPGAGWSIVDTINGIGLAEQMAMVRRGPLAGRVYLPSIDPAGPPDIVTLSIDAPGVVADLGEFNFPDGSANVPQGIAITP